MIKPLPACKWRLPGMVCRLTGKACSELNCPFNYT